MTIPQKAKTHSQMNTLHALDYVLFLCELSNVQKYTSPPPPKLRNLQRLKGWVMATNTSSLNYWCKSSLKLKSYGFICTSCERDSLPLPSRHLTAWFLISSGSWKQIQSNKESRSFAKSSKYQSSNLGIIILFVFVMPIEACK